MPETLNVRRLAVAGTVIGLGMGGFFDGILFHQILQLHSMLTGRLPKTTIPNIEVNMFWDGLFHAATWTLTLIGLFLLWSAVKDRTTLLDTRSFLGSLLLGWGLFNLVEGVIDHLVLGLHHVVENAPNHLPADLAFLASGVVLIVVGWGMIRRESFAPADLRSPARSGSPAPF
jgi:uncharacterized membrane protein